MANPFPILGNPEPVFPFFPPLVRTAPSSPSERRKPSPPPVHTVLRVGGKSPSPPPIARTRKTRPFFSGGYPLFSPSPLASLFRRSRKLQAPAFPRATVLIEKTRSFSPPCPPPTPLLSVSSESVCSISLRFKKELGIPFFPLGTLPLKASAFLNSPPFSNKSSGRNWRFFVGPEMVPFFSFLSFPFSHLRKWRGFFLFRPSPSASGDFMTPWPSPSFPSSFQVNQIFPFSLSFLLFPLLLPFVSKNSLFCSLTRFRLFFSSPGKKGNGLSPPPFPPFFFSARRRRKISPPFFFPNG